MDDYLSIPRRFLNASRLKTLFFQGMNNDQTVTLGEVFAWVLSLIVAGAGMIGLPDPDILPVPRELRNIFPYSVYHKDDLIALIAEHLSPSNIPDHVTRPKTPKNADGFFLAGKFLINILAKVAIKRRLQPHTYITFAQARRWLKKYLRQNRKKLRHPKNPDLIKANRALFGALGRKIFHKKELNQILLSVLHTVSLSLKLKYKSGPYQFNHGQKHFFELRPNEPVTFQLPAQAPQKVGVAFMKRSRDEDQPDFTVLPNLGAPFILKTASQEVAHESIQARIPKREGAYGIYQICTGGRTTTFSVEYDPSQWAQPQKTGFTGSWYILTMDYNDVKTGKTRFPVEECIISIAKQCMPHPYLHDPFEIFTCSICLRLPHTGFMARCEGSCKPPICSSCQKQLKRCPTCKTRDIVAYPQMSIKLTQFLMERDWLCPNWEQGCRQLLGIRYLTDHEMTCKKNRFPCLQPFCKFKGNILDIARRDHVCPGKSDGVMDNGDQVFNISAIFTPTKRPDETLLPDQSVRVMTVPLLVAHTDPCGRNLAGSQPHIDIRYKYIADGTAIVYVVPFAICHPLQARRIRMTATIKLAGNCKAVNPEEQTTPFNAWGTNGAVAPTTRQTRAVFCVGDTGRDNPATEKIWLELEVTVKANYFGWTGDQPLAHFVIPNVNYKEVHTRDIDNMISRFHHLGHSLP